MTNQRIRVAVNGYGVIGKRIADAVAAQEDMELVGVADVVSDWRIKVTSLHAILNRRQDHHYLQHKRVKNLEIRL